ncbi:type II toxin-antitoxin system PemK/MazF family toxin [Methylobacterium thuringiense]|uniref:type II toxin-antitoxin system PemK/MazF family toxin n=1 Tax=Methylobacterium thuringiense TaxID=1003091 RepID=UPI001EE042C3|nr:type II toxin-antitoxin system PemK/MazF family toxin [Methylobacterium thuringiense]
MLHWIVLTPEAVNVHGVAIAVVVSTVAQGARDSGLAVSVRGDGVTGIAICTQVRSFDLRARIADGSASFVGNADAATIDELGARIASLIDP